MLCAKFGWNWPSGSGKDHFLKTFHHFVIISPWKRTGPFIWTDLVLNMHVCFVRNFVEIGPVVLEKKINVFSLFCNYLPLEKGRALHLSSSPKNALCQVWLKLAKWFWRRRFFKAVNLFLLFPNYLPFGKGVALHLNNLESPSPRDTLCQVWLKLGQWFWRRGRKCEKFYRQTDRWMEGQTDDGWQVIRKAHLSFQLRWAKNANTMGLKMSTTPSITMQTPWG